jgi:hypothetical protein
LTCSLALTLFFLPAADQIAVRKQIAGKVHDRNEIF